MEDYATYSINDLLEKITIWPVGMPVRAMEHVLALGESALPALTQAPERWRGDENRDLLWLIVLLGEIGSANGVPTLIDMRPVATACLAISTVNSYPGAACARRHTG